MAGMFVPQMVASTGSDPLSGLANLTNRIGQWREDAQLADIMKGFDPANPYSYEDTLHRLGTSGIPGGRDMQDRILGIAEARRKAQETEQTGTYRQGQLDVQQRTLNLGQQRLKMEQDIYKAGLENTKWGQQFLQNRPPLPAAGDVPAATATPPATEGPPLPSSPWERYVPGNKPGPGAAAPTIMKPIAASAAPEEPVAPVASTGAAAPGAPVAPTRTAALATPMGGVPVSDASGVGFNEPVPGASGVQRAGAMLGTGPAPVQTAARGGARGTVPPPATGLPPSVAPAPVAVPPPAAAAPTAREPGVQGSFPSPGLTAAPPERIGKDEANLNAWIDYYRQGKANLRDPSQIKAADEIIEDLKKRRDTISGAREEAAKQEAESRKELRKKINEGEAVDLTKMKDEAFKAASEGNELRAQMDAITAVANHPNYWGGQLGGPMEVVSGLAMGWRQMSQKIAEMTGTKLNQTADEFIGGYMTDVNTRLKQVGSIGNTITLKLLGGSLSKSVSNDDRTFVQRIGSSPDDSREAILAKGLLVDELVARANDQYKLISSLSQRHYTTTQIRDALQAYGEERRSFRNADGTLTELGRRISPQMENEEKARLQAREKRAAQAGEEFRDTSGTGEAAVMGYRPSATEKKQVRERDTQEAPVPSRGYRGPGAPFPPVPLGLPAPPTPTLPPEVTSPPAPPLLTGPVPPRGYRGPGAPLPAEPSYSGPGAPLPPASAAPPPTVPYASGSEVVQPAAAVVGAPPLTAGERFDQWVRGRVNPAEAIPRAEAPTPRPTPIEAAVVSTAGGRRRGEALDAARRARGITSEPQRYFDDPTEASVAQNRDYMRKISEQALRRDPRGLRPELFRESTRVEYQPRPYDRLLSNFSNVDQEAAAERNLLTLPPRGRLSDQAGLATLETIMRSRGIPENVTSQIIQRGDEQRLRDLVNKPLPKPRDNSAAESKATVERENRRRDRRTAP